MPVEFSELAPELSLLRIDQLSGLEALFFTGWDELGNQLVSARLPDARLRAPASLALPGTGWGLPECRVYGYGKSVGFVALAASTAAPRRQ